MSNKLNSTLIAEQREKLLIANPGLKPAPNIWGPKPVNQHLLGFLNNLEAKAKLNEEAVQS